MNKQAYRNVLNGKTVVITGASSGIGRAAAIAFAQNGANIVLAARRENVLSEVAAECESYGVRALSVKTDVTDADAVSKLADQAVNFGGAIFVWVNNAGIGSVGEFTQTPVEAHQRVIETNLMGYIHGAHAVLPYFRLQSYGVLINTVSLGAWIAQPYSVAYAASKFGLRGFSEALRGELKNFPNIHVCDIFPGFIDTPGFQHGANYMGRKIKPIPPVNDARRVAKAMLKLSIRPKDAVTIGASASLMKLANVLFPGITQAILVTLMEVYFKRAQQVPTSDGSLFHSGSIETGIDGGWRSSNTLRNASIATAALAGIAVAVYGLKSKQKKKKSMAV
jgi:short-subunit dehydrogenase